jgi:hypothetical protein
VSEGSAQDATWLSREATHLHACLFNAPAGPEFIARYVKAHGVLLALAASTGPEDAAIRRIVERGLDAAAIEPWLRGAPGRRHLLCRKVLLALHLSECGGGRPVFFQPLAADVPWPLAWLVLLRLGVQSAVRLASGRFMIARHGLR